MSKPEMKEYGRIGQRRFGGVFYEEFLKELKGRKGIEVYREMSENDSTIGGVLYAVEMLIRQADWHVNPVSDKEVDVKCAEFLESCLYDMQDTWTDTLSEIMSFLTFGWSLHEIVYKRRMGHTNDEKTDSIYSDGLIGLRKLALRGQETLYQWEYDDEDNLIGMTQMPPPDYRIATIPIKKAVLFRTKSRKNNPEGRSILRSAYRDWYFKKRIQEIEGIGVERDLAGLPVLTAPEGVDIWSDSEDMQQMYQSAMAIVQSIRRDQCEGVVLPGPNTGKLGWKLELLTSGGRRQFDTGAIIERYDSRIAMSVMADFILLGHQQVGSFALSSDKTELFSVALGAYMDIICEAISKQVFPRLIGLNAEHFEGITEIPDLSHGDIENPDLEKLGGFVQRMVQVGTIIPDEALEDHLRNVSGLPERMENTQFDAQARRQQEVDENDDANGENRRKPQTPPRGQKRGSGVDADALDEEDEEDAKAAHRARKAAIFGLDEDE